MVTAGSCAKMVAGKHVMTPWWPVLLYGHCSWGHARQQVWFGLNGTGVKLVINNEFSPGGAVACLFDDLCSGWVRAWNCI